MNKFMRTAVIVPLYALAYGGLIVWSVSDPLAGFLLLAVVDLVGIPVAIFVLYKRVVEAHTWLPRRTVNRVMPYVLGWLLVVAILHVVAAFMGDGEARWMVGYLVPALPLIIGGIRVLMPDKKDRP